MTKTIPLSSSSPIKSDLFGLFDFGVRTDLVGLAVTLYCGWRDAFWAAGLTGFSCSSSFALSNTWFRKSGESPNGYWIKWARAASAFTLGTLSVLHFSPWNTLKWVLEFECKTPLEQIVEPVVFDYWYYYRINHHQYYLCSCFQKDLHQCLYLKCFQIIHQFYFECFQKARRSYLCSYLYFRKGLLNVNIYKI